MAGGKLPKLLLPRDKFRQMGIARLREYLDGLEAMSEAGQFTQEAYNTMVYATAELERRKAKRAARPPMLMRPSELYLLRAEHLRGMIAALQDRDDLSETEANTLSALLVEETRRKRHAKYIYQKRKAGAARRAAIAQEVMQCSTLSC